MIGVNAGFCGTCLGRDAEIGRKDSLCGAACRNAQHEGPNFIGRSRRRGSQPDVGLVLLDDLAGQAHYAYQQVRGHSLSTVANRRGDEGIFERGFLHIFS